MLLVYVDDIVVTKNYYILVDARLRPLKRPRDLRPFLKAQIKIYERTRQAKYILSISFVRSGLNEAIFNVELAE